VVPFVGLAYEDPSQHLLTIENAHTDSSVF
jgi:hypothetical protein